MRHQAKQLLKRPDVHKHIWRIPVCSRGLSQNPSCYLCQDVTNVSGSFNRFFPPIRFNWFPVQAVRKISRTFQSSLLLDLDYLFRRCERNPCPVENKACSQTPNSFSYHYMAVVSNLSAPRVMFRVSALRQIGDTLRFSLLGGKQARRHFTVQRSDRLTGQLMLVTPVQGPATVEAEVEMSELERRVQVGRYITKVTLFVSQYDF